MPATISSSLLPHSQFLIQARNFSLTLGPGKTKIMGIVNITPDSFSGDGCRNPHQAVKLGLQHIEEGADILDIGGESSRPGATKISSKEEIKRVVPTIKKLVKVVKIPLSIDTYKSDVAQAGLDSGASIVNNIKGVSSPTGKNLLKMVQRYGAAIVLMHMRGTPKTMQKKIHYQDLIKEVMDDLKIAIENCLEIGIKSDKIIIDPGIGFAKTAVHNLEILKHLREFSKLNMPILVGPSRKSFLGKILNRKPEDRLFGTVASVVAAALNGAHIVRVHDIKAVREALLVTDAILNS